MSRTIATLLAARRREQTSALRQWVTVLVVIAVLFGTVWLMMLA